MGDKVNARRAAAALGIPTVPGSPEPVATVAAAEAATRATGFPVLLKAAAGGGGRGMRIVRDRRDLAEAFARAAAEAEAAFGDARLYLERYLEDIRHIEVQVLADAHGNVVDLGERDCSVQRRHQKLIEEAPAPALDPGIRRALAETATALVRAIGYRNAGTVEFVFDRPSGRFYFIEMNTRIQVEHPVSEMITGVDIVHEQLRIAAGQPLDPATGRSRRGHAVEFRINAEDPAAGFRPSPGRISAWQEPQGEGIRIDTHCAAGTMVPPFYDSLLAKLIVHGESRSAALGRAVAAIDVFRIDGVATTLPFHRRVAASNDFAAADVNTRWVEESVLITA
jgi:acetyl-CoA carboxylase biotin carboxylase subunit